MTSMSSELLFLTFIAVGLAIVAIVIAFMYASEHRHRMKRLVLDRINAIPWDWWRKPRETDLPVAGGAPRNPTEEEESKAELERLQAVIEEQKKMARDTDVSYHLWGFYQSRFRRAGLRALERPAEEGDWLGVKILRTETQNGLNKCDFELKGARYRFVDDEENQGWCDNAKFFSLYLYDDSDRCLIEIPMKLKVDKWGRNYSLVSDGPRAFRAGDWINEFITVKLRHQRARNQEIRSQKHQERLWEIEDLKNRFGISD